MTLKRDCWLVMQHQQTRDGNHAYCVQGIFDDESVAASQCLTYQYCVVPMTMNETIPHEFHEHKEIYFPIAAK